MEIANCRLRLNKVGSDVPLTDVTPAEAMFLHILHGPSNGGLSFGEEFNHIKVVGAAKVKNADGTLRDRTPAEEYRRLAGKYSGARDKTNKPIIETIWPDRLNPKMPNTFKEVQWQEVASAGIETAAVNYATGGLASSVVPDKK